MAKLSRIFLFLLIANIQEPVKGFKNVIVNNKPMTYNRKGELIEAVKIPKTVNKAKPVEIVEKSNIFKNSAFVTNSKFKGGTHRFESELLEKNNLTKSWLLPTRGQFKIWNTNNKATKPPKIHRSSTAFPSFPELTSELSTTEKPSQTSILFNDEFVSVENSLHHIYNDIFKNDFNKFPSITERPRPVESTHEKPLIFFYTSPTPPTTNFPFTSSTTKRPKKKKKPTTTTPLPIHEHFLQNIDFYRQLLMINCSNQASTTTTEEPFIAITPKPKKQLGNRGTLSYEELQSDVSTTTSAKKNRRRRKKNKKRKKDCKKKKREKPHRGKFGSNYGEGPPVYQGSKPQGSLQTHGSYHGSHISPNHQQLVQNQINAPLPGLGVLTHDIHNVQGNFSNHGHTHSSEQETSGLESDQEGQETHQPSHIHSDDNVIYYDDSPELEQNDNILTSFYNFIEDAFTSKEFVDDNGQRHDVSYEYSDSEDDSSHLLRRRKKSTDTQVQRRSDFVPRKSMTTKITVASEYDDSVATKVPPVNQIVSTRPVIPPRKKPPSIKRRPLTSSEESDEDYTLYDELVGFRDDSDEIDSYEDYDDAPKNRLPIGEKIKDRLKAVSEENEEPSPSIFDGVTGMFSTLGNFFSALTGFGDVSRRDSLKRKQDYDYDDEDDEGRSTTEKVEQQSKRPKRENEPLAWYQPSFLFSNRNDDDKPFGSTEQPNWLPSPWQHDDDDIGTEMPATTKSSSVESSSEKPSFFEMVSSYLSPTRRSSTRFTSKNRRKRYDSYQLIRITADSKEDLKTIEDFKMSKKGTKVHWLKGPSSRTFTDVVVPPDYTEDFREFLTENEIPFATKVRNIQHAIQFENPRLNKRDQIEMEVIYGHPLTWYRYHPYRDIQAYFDYLKRKFSDYVDLVQLGWSFEGRPLTIVKISHPNSDSKSELRKEPRMSLGRSAIFIQAGLEAHEWLSIASTTYIINNLISKIDGNDTLAALIRKTDWYIMPVANPDGYDYSIHYDRLWQKTRSAHSSQTGFFSTA